MKHLMIDLETLDNRSNSAILSIGAVEFDMETGETGLEFYENVSLQSSLDYGLNVKGSTFYWWMSQSDEARLSLTTNMKDLPEVLVAFNKWFLTLDYDIEIWGNGSRFDIGILEDAYVATSINTPWNFRGERDVRTLVSLNPKFKRDEEFVGCEHNPIDDCKHQIKYCIKTHNSLTINETN